MTEDDKQRLNDLLNTSVGGDNNISKNTAGFGLGLYISNFLA